MSHLSRLTLAGTMAVLSLAGCAQKAATKSTTVTSPSNRTHVSTPASDSGSASPVKLAPHRATGGAGAAATNAKLPERTGISACDDYLSSYLGCHRAASIFAPGQLQGRFNAMRTSLLNDSQDPAIRPQLAARCSALASQLRQALHGKSCDANAATPSTSP